MNRLQQTHDLPQELAEIQRQMAAHASQYGLDFFPTIFELVSADELNAIAAYGGFPTRYPHWRFGMEFEQLSKAVRNLLADVLDPDVISNP